MPCFNRATRNATAYFACGTKNENFLAASGHEISLSTRVAQILTLHAQLDVADALAIGLDAPEDDEQVPVR